MIGSGNPKPSTAPSVTLIVNPTSGTVNIVSPILTWSVANATTCTAGGDWKGTRSATTIDRATKLPNSIRLGILTTVKTYTYTLTCQNDAKVSASATATVIVTSPFTSAKGVCDQARFSCKVGTSKLNATNAVSYDWVCSGLNGGVDVPCSSPK